MSIFDVLSMIGGLCLFLFGMNLMGQALERRAGNKLRSILGKMTTKRIPGFLTGCGVTAVIQSSSATTVMVVGFVNSGLMTLQQATNVIMGANVGTTITGWILSLGGITSDNLWVRLLEPMSFTPVLALIGVIFLMFCKSSKKKDTGTILLGFATLMFGMNAMTGAVSVLADVPAFREVFLLFKNPILGLLAGTVLTGVIQSSSASVGILQALSMTGQVSFSAAIPILMGDGIGATATAMLSSIGAKKEAKRAAFVHLFFNVIGSAVWMAVYMLIRALFAPAILDEAASPVSIALLNTTIRLLNTALLLPMANLLVKLVCKIVPNAKTEEKSVELDDRLLATPPMALSQCRTVAVDMAEMSVHVLKNGLRALKHYTPELAESMREEESRTDHYEDILGTYLIKLSSQPMSDSDSEEATMLLKVIGDFERIADHGINLLESVEELRDKKLTFSDMAMQDFAVISAAIREILDISLNAFKNNDPAGAIDVEPLEQVIDELKEQMRTRHILRMQQGHCSIEAGFVWADMLTCLERTSDHCSNIAGCLIDTAHHTLNIHETQRATKNGNADFDARFGAYAEKYALSV